jgi:hypothetical protein
MGGKRRDPLKRRPGKTRPRARSTPLAKVSTPSNRHGWPRATRTIQNPARHHLGHDLAMDFAAQVRSSLKAGHTPDQVAQALMHDSGLLPISAIKALRSGGDMTLVEAKEVIQRNLSAEQWAATKELWEMIAGGDDV